MRDHVYFVSVVLLTGWVLGYLLAELSQGTSEPSPVALLVSFIAVSLPACMALLLVRGSRKRWLRDQIRAPGLAGGLVCLSFPLCLYVAGYLPHLLPAADAAELIPGRSVLAGVMPLLPMLLLWALLEELGWRGYLVTELARTRSALHASLLVGVIWGLWHVPQIFYSDLPYGGAFRDQPFIGAVLWLASTTAIGGVLGWLQLTTGSFILPGITHALINTAGMLLSANGQTPWNGTGGLAAVLMGVLLTVVLFAWKSPVCKAVPEGNC